MQSILKIISVVVLAGLAACDSGPQQHATLMPGAASQNNDMAMQSPVLPGAAGQSQSANAPSSSPPAAQASASAPPAADPSASPAAAAEAPSASANAVPPPNGVMMPTAAPPVPAYGDPTVQRTPYFYPPVGMGVHVPR